MSHNNNNNAILHKPLVVAFLSNDPLKLAEWEVNFCSIDFKYKQFVDGFSLFKSLLNEPITVLVVYFDEASKILFEGDISRYLAINPDLIIILIVDANFSSAKKIFYLDKGVDRFLINPITCDLLLSNIYAATRQSQDLIETPSLNDAVGWTLNTNGWLLKAPSGKTLQLTAREFNLLNILALKRGETVNKHFLAEKLLGRYNQNGSRRMTLLVGRLRKKVMEALDCELPITTVHSIGYACVSAILIE